MIFDVTAWLGVWPFRSLRDNTPADLVARMDRSGIDAAAVSQIEAVFHRNPQPANEKLAASVAPFADRLVPMATINPTIPNWEDDLAACTDGLGMRGIRLCPQYQGYEVTGPETRAVLEACAERGLPVSIPHRLEDTREHHWIDPGKAIGLDQIADLVAAVPAATLIVPNARGFAHSALWQRTELRDAPWYVDTSLAEVHYVLHRDLSRTRELSEFIDQGGAKHLLFGTHLPFSYAGPALVKRAVLPVDDDTRAEICWRAPRRVFHLDG